MKKNLNELFDRATPQEMEQFSDALNAPALSNEALASVKNKVYAKTKLNRERRSVKVQWLRVGALAACLCLLVTGIFGGVGLLKNQFGDAAPVTQSAPDLPLDHYPNGEVDYANMSMVEYMELFPDFLSYRYMPWHEGYAFAHLEILEVKNGYRYEYNNNCYVVKCRVISDAWNVLEEGSELNFVTDEWDFFRSVSSVLLRLPVRGTFSCVNADGEKIKAMLFEINLEYLGCFPVEDGKIQLNKIETYLKEYNKKLNYVSNSIISYDPDYVYCTFEDVASLVGEGMAVETAVENLHNVYEKYQTGEYNYLSADLVSTMTYGEYCRVLEGTWTEEDRANFGPTFALEYIHLPPLFSIELSLSDGTTFEFCTRMELPESLVERLMKEKVVELEAVCTDENGKLDAEKCIEMIKELEIEYGFRAFLERSPRS